MADQNKGPGFEGIGEIPADARRTEIIESVDSETEKGKISSQYPGDDDRAKKILERLATTSANEAKQEPETEDFDIEQKKERLISRLVEAALAAKDDIGEAKKIIDRAEKYLGKYPGLVDEIHDRWLEERNKGN